MECFAILEVKVIMKIYFDKKLYSKDALIKAAYTFIEDTYVYLSQDDNNYIVEISFKDGKFIDDIDGKLKNEMLIQCARQVIYNNTKDIRKIILARAMASTIIDKNESENSVPSDNDGDLDRILSDWFDENDN